MTRVMPELRLIEYRRRHLGYVFPERLQLPSPPNVLLNASVGRARWLQRQGRNLSGLRV